MSNNDTYDCCSRCGDPLPVDRILMGIDICEICEYNEAQVRMDNEDSNE